jgi:hypothetical protein
MTEQLPVKSELQIFVDGGCRGHRNRRHIADSQVAVSNVGMEQAVPEVDLLLCLLCGHPKVRLLGVRKGT